MSLPIIRGSSQAIYPFTVSYCFVTGLGQFQNGNQQRWIKAPGLVKFSIPYPALSQAQKNTLLAAITSAKGGFDTTLQLTLGATNYTNLSLDSDDFLATESSSMMYDAPVKLSQTIGQLLPGTSGTAFPTLASGEICKLTYAQGRRFQTISTKMEAGPKYTYPEFGGGLANYPGASGLMRWELNEQHLSDADRATRVNHFVANWGRAIGFTFTDEDSTPYAATHYAMDELTVTHNGPNDASTKISLEVTNN